MASACTTRLTATRIAARCAGGELGVHAMVRIEGACVALRGLLKRARKLRDVL
jgi:hypothetical protein